MFIIGHFRGSSGREVFPITKTNQYVGNEIKRLGHSVYYRRVLQTFDKKESVEALDTMQGGNRQPCVKVAGNVNPSGNGMNGQVYKCDGISPTLTTNKGEGAKIIQPVLTPERLEKRQNGRRFKDNGEPMFTLTSQDRHGVAIHQKPRGNNKGGTHEIAPTVTSNSYQENNHLNDGYRIRKLTPRECWRLQGFPDYAFDKAAEVNSNSQLYKQAGNSVTVNVIQEIARKLKMNAN